MDLAQFSEMVRCRCDPAWTGRKLHAPNCTDWLIEEATELVTAAEARGFERALNMLQDEAWRAWENDSETSNFTYGWSLFDAITFLEGKRNDHRHAAG